MLKKKRRRLFYFGTNHIRNIFLYLFLCETVKMEESKFIAQLLSVHKEIKRMAHYISKGNREFANDILQDTLLKMLLNKEKFKTKSGMQSWAYIIMCNIYRSRRKRETIEELYQPHTPTIMKGDNLTAKEILKEIDKLPKEQSEALRLTILGYSYAEIAQMTGESVSTIRGRIYQARRHLQSVLKD